MRIEFKLGMPGRNSWNGKWSGEERNYTKVVTMTDRKADVLLEGRVSRSWGYNFGDGWYAVVKARPVQKGERLRKSDGFCGYDWMVYSILADGEIYGPTRPRPGASPKETDGTLLVNDDTPDDD